MDRPKDGNDTEPLPLDVALRHAFAQDRTAAGVAAEEADPDYAVGTILAGRYEIVAERGRGGIGILFAARDRVLNRDVAVKVLRAEHRRRGMIVRRFLAEAQITGQLQHPSIAPVHDLGIGPDGRPFLVMKLVQGATLAELLVEGSPVALVAVLARVAEAVAFAHARSVVHRDLKPANVMVGEYGEVQVMDWGIAKIVAPSAATGGPATGEQRRAGTADPVATVRGEDPRTVTVAGSVIGTPAYMSPEQARGEVDTVDARTDVFSIGAILCELLTGGPPYAPAGTDTAALRNLAAAGDLTHSHRRLEAAAAEPFLVELCRRCLAPDREARPRDAGEVAAALRHHAAEAAERSRRAELAAAKAQARAAAELRGGRWRLAAVAVVLGVAFVAACLWSWGEAEARDRLDRATREAELAMRDVWSRRARLADDPAAEPAWVEVAQMAHRARDVARTGGADPAVVARAAQLAEETVRELAGLRAAWQQRARDAALVQRLEALAVFGTGDWQFARVDRLYLDAFATYGVDVAAVDPGPAAAAIQASAVRDHMVDGLAYWSSVRKNAPPDEAVEAALVRLMDLVDTDAFRTKIRATLAAGDLVTLRAMAAAHDPGALPANALTLATSLGRLGDVPAAVDLLRRVHPHHPDSFFTNFFLAHGLHEIGADRSEVIRYYTAALALAPDSMGAGTNLAVVLVEAERLDEAEVLFRRLVAAHPERAATWWNLAAFLDKSGRGDGGQAAVDRVLAIEPTHDGGLWLRGRLHRRARRFADAERDLRAGMAAHSGRGHAQVLGAMLCDDLDRPREAAELFRQVIGCAPHAPQPRLNLGVALMRLGDLDGALAAFRQCVERDPGQALAYASMGRILCHRNDVPAALAAARKAFALEPDRDRQEQLARCLLRSGRFDEARGHLAACGSDTLPIWLELARDAAGGGQVEAALQACGRALEIDPDDDAALRMRDVLSSSIRR